MGLEWIAILFVVGLAFMFAEPFIPAGGVLGLVGLICFGVSVFFGFREHGVWIGVTQLVLGAIFGAFAVNLFFRRMAHTDQLQASPVLSETGGEDLVGASGETITPLRPTGTALIQGRRMSVLTRGEMLGRGARVVVVVAHGNRIIVEAAPDPVATEPTALEPASADAPAEPEA